MPEFVWADQVIPAESCFRSQIQAYQANFGDATLVGYTFDDNGEAGAHYVHVLPSWNNAEKQVSLLRVACHLLVDSAPDDSLSELLEKAVEIREYYCSLQNWTDPAIAEPVGTGSVQVSNIYEREAFAYSEE